ncbi:MAG: hypothetical protein PHQ04_00630 [Opitutaceae bacterium]|nr:hypothetical protein [Opitutaceae bacterium]
MPLFSLLPGRFRARLLAALVLALMGVPFLGAEETLAERTLKEIIERERDVFARARAEGEEIDEGRLKGEAQSLAQSYNVLLQQAPDFAPAYVAYGMMLGRVGMTREALAILFKANELDPKLPLVKNQMAKLLAEDGKPVEALPWIMAAIDLAPREPLYHFQLGLLLYAAREEFLHTGAFTRPALDKAMLDAFRHAAELAPDNIAYAYRHAEAFYDLDQPQWDEALKAWGAIEDRVASGLEKQTIRLHAANIFLKQGKPDHARTLLDTVTDGRIARQKQTLLDQLASKVEK